MPDDVPELHSRARLELLIDMLEDSRGGSVSRKMAGNVSCLTEVTLIPDLRSDPTYRLQQSTYGESANIGR